MKKIYKPFFSERRILTEASHARTLRYSSSVRFWKSTLSTIALGTFIGLFAWPYLIEHFHEINADEPAPKNDVPEITLTNRLLKPRFKTLDKQGRPVTIQAESAIQVSETSAEMIKPKSQLCLQAGQEICVESDNGHYDPENRIFQYDKHVKVRGEDGTQLDTDSASVDLERQEAEGHMPVSGHSSRGKLAGEGFKILNEGKEVHLLGKSKLVINNNNG